MSSNAANWRRVTRSDRCPVCGKPDWCLVSRDGSAAICPRTESTRRAGNAGWLHDLSGDPVERVQTPRDEPPPAIRDFSSLADLEFARGEEQRRALARELGVELRSLVRLGVGWDVIQECWTFPERNADGDVIGLLRRFEDGTKRRWSGSRCGLAYADDWDTGSGPVLLVEGPSDVAALMDTGLSVVGRPSNTGGVAHLAKLLTSLTLDREIVVVGEWDEKPSGLWPGRDGAVRTAEQLSERLERPIGWCLPPDGAKDARAWRREFPDLPSDRLASFWLDGIDVEVLDPPPVFRPTRETVDDVSLDEWRTRMRERREISLTEVGVWLDRSPTGAGKSWVDHAVLLANVEPAF